MFVNDLLTWIYIIDNCAWHRPYQYFRKAQNRVSISCSCCKTEQKIQIFVHPHANHDL